METTKPRSLASLLLTEKLVLVDFSTKWCEQCKTLLQELTSWVGDNATVIEINVDQNLLASSQYRVTAFPTFLLFRDGEVVWRHSGATDLGTLQRTFQQFE